MTHFSKLDQYITEHSIRSVLFREAYYKGEKPLTLDYICSFFDADTYDRQYIHDVCERSGYPLT